MKIKVKIIESNKTEWLGFFGDCIKLRIPDTNEESISDFISKDFGVSKDLISLTKDGKNSYILELPDEGYEILLSSI